MQEYFLNLFNEYPQLAILISLSLSVVIAILGLVPSVFVTAANILFFGVINGTLISFVGEALGAGIAFVIYRKGFKKITEQKLGKYKMIGRLIQAENRQAFYLIFSLRLIPFVPSGLITFAAAIGKVSFYIFIISSSLGKLPALLMEAWSVYEVTRFGWQGKLILLVIAISLLYWIMRKKKKAGSYE